jgi:hypothetical protein
MLHEVHCPDELGHNHFLVDVLSDYVESFEYRTSKCCERSGNFDGILDLIIVINHFFAEKIKSSKQFLRLVVSNVLPIKFAILIDREHLANPRPHGKHRCKLVVPRRFPNLPPMNFLINFVDDQIIIIVDIFIC